MFQMGNNTGIEVPAEVVAALDAGKDHPSSSGSTATNTGRPSPMSGKYLLPFGADRRKESGIQGGDDAIDVELTLDTAPRTVGVPDDLQSALDASPAAAAAWDKLSNTHKKEHARSVLDAKKPETRTRRIAAVISKLEGS
jgi:Bacteriocin-protection, YdeI or OmpD-Associated